MDISGEHGAASPTGEVTAGSWLCPRGSHLCSRRSSSAEGLDFNAAARGWDDTGIMQEQMEVPGD